MVRCRKRGKGVLKEFQIPNIVIVIPLCPMKVEDVKKQLSSIDPKVLFFLSKIKKL